jgi:hypothetical protein
VTVCSDRAGHFTVVADIPRGSSAIAQGALVAYTSAAGALGWSRATVAPVVPSGALVTSACGPSGEAVIVYQVPAPRGAASLYETTRGSLTGGWSVPTLVGQVTKPVGWAGLSYPPQLAAIDGRAATVAWLSARGVQTRTLP